MSATIEPLINRHRPASYAEVCGHDGAVQALQRSVAAAGRPHSYLLTGPSGVGKTTLARLIAQQIGAEVEPVDAASHSGVEAMRDRIKDGLWLLPGAVSKMVIVDECQALSRAAWQAALHAVEEPPSHLYWAFVTTEVHRVPVTIVNRCYHVPLTRLSDEAIEDWLWGILVKEDWAKTANPEVFQLVVDEAAGSPRQALSLLQACFDIEDVEDARRVIALQNSVSEPMREILEHLVRGQKHWDDIRPYLLQLADEDITEGSIIGACRYITTAFCRRTDGNEARRLWELLAALCYPVHSYDPKTIFIHAVGRMVFGAV
jgi:DNA polymerase-3 subunit gamma/tau